MDVGVKSVMEEGNKMKESSFNECEIFMKLTQKVHQLFYWNDTVTIIEYVPIDRWS